VSGYQHFISERQLRLASRLDTNEPFSDIPGLMRAVPLSQRMFEAAMTTRCAPARSSDTLLYVERLPFCTVYSKFQPVPVVTLAAGTEWLAKVLKELPEGMAEGLMTQACWRTANRVVRGSRERTQLARRAFKAFASAFPDDPRVQRQPLQGAAA
jgi:hypothetical protein